MYFRGLLDEVQVYSRALVTSEVLSRAQHGLGLKGRGQRLGGASRTRVPKKSRRPPWSAIQPLTGTTALHEVHRVQPLQSSVSRLFGYPFLGVWLRACLSSPSQEQDCRRDSRLRSNLQVPPHRKTVKCKVHEVRLWLSARWERRLCQQLQHPVLVWHAEPDPVERVARLKTQCTACQNPSVDKLSSNSNNYSTKRSERV